MPPPRRQRPRRRSCVLHRTLPNWSSWAVRSRNRTWYSMLAMAGPHMACIEYHVLFRDLTAQLDQFGSVLCNTQDLRLGLCRRGGGIDADHAVCPPVCGEANHHAGLCTAGDRANHNVIESETELGLLSSHLFRKADET